MFQKQFPQVNQTEWQTLIKDFVFIDEKCTECMKVVNSFGGVELFSQWIGCQLRCLFAQVNISKCYVKNHILIHKMNTINQLINQCLLMSCMITKIVN